MSFYKVSESGSVVQYTDQETPEPVSSGKAFFQHKQSASSVDGRCFMYAIHAMGGHAFVVEKELIAFSNMTLAQELSTDEAGLKSMNEFISDEADLNKKGISPIVAVKYIQSQKPALGLSSTSEIRVFEGLYTGVEFQTAIKTLKNSGLDRAILGLGGEHYLAVRKDKAKQWRVVDSQVFSHDKGAKDKVKELQPSFPVLEKAVDHAVKSRGAQHCILIYPKSKDKSWMGVIAIVSLTVVGGAIFYCRKTSLHSPQKVK